MRCLVAVDAGTTSVRALATDLAGRVLDVSNRELSQSYPHPGWVEQDPAEILRLVDETLAELVGRLGARGDEIAAIGITNQRETTVALDRADGRLLAPAIVWQDRRTTDACVALADAGNDGRIRAITGLPVDPYFSATKMRWLLDTGQLDDARDLGLCTVDTLVCWHLTGGPRGGVFATDPSNASRTMLYDLAAAAWSDELCALLDVPRNALASVMPSCGPFGSVAPGIVDGLEGVRITGILGDQQAALFGQRCTSEGMVKATFGTGSFLLANAGSTRPDDVDGLVTTVAWDLGLQGARTYALEGANFVAGAAIQWLRDELDLLSTSTEIGPLAASVEDANGALFVPALAGLGSPWWDPSARGAITGLSRGVTRAHLARAVVDALGFQGRSVLEAMRSGGVALTELRVDGGAVAMDLLCQSLANGARLVVRRPTSIEATAVGAATVAGVGSGDVDLAELEAGWEQEAAFDPVDDPVGDATYAAWLDAVARSRAIGAQLPLVT